jgi:hypothetical protein
MSGVNYFRKRKGIPSEKMGTKKPGESHLSPGLDLGRFPESYCFDTTPPGPLKM